MFIDLLRSRRSIRQFQKKPVEQEKIDLLIEAALRSPTSRGLNPWEFIFVTEPKILEKLAVAKAHGSSFVKNAALAVVVCAHPDKSDVWVEDTAIASIILHLAAADLGLGSCWIQIRRREHDAALSAEDYVKQLLGLEQSLMVEAMIAVGYPAETKAGHDRAGLLDERISFERYGVKR
ncbi:MAG: nitroreductase family protein [Desulfofustis sp.]|nr:nitroreductase family protein [Desulfofustis sp.]